MQFIFDNTFRDILSGFTVSCTDGTKIDEDIYVYGLRGLLSTAEFEKDV